MSVFISLDHIKSSTECIYLFLHPSTHPPIYPSIHLCYSEADRSGWMDTISFHSFCLSLSPPPLLPFTTSPPLSLSLSLSLSHTHTHTHTHTNTPTHRSSHSLVHRPLAMRLNLPSGVLREKLSSAHRKYYHRWQYRSRLPQNSSSISAPLISSALYINFSGNSLKYFHYLQLPFGERFHPKCLESVRF